MQFSTICCLLDRIHMSSENKKDLYTQQYNWLLIVQKVYQCNNKSMEKMTNDVSFERANEDMCVACTSQVELLPHPDPLANSDYPAFWQRDYQHTGLNHKSTK